MPRPASVVRASQSPQNGSRAHRATPRQSDPAQMAGALSGLVGRLLTESVKGSASISVANLAASLRCLAALLEGSASDLAAPDAAPPTPTISSEFKAPDDISLDAQTLLSALVSHRRGVERTAPDHAWQTKNAWFKWTRIRPDRKDAGSLIDELIAARFIDERYSGAKGRWHQYRATTAGAQYIARLDPHGVFRRTSE